MNGTACAVPRLLIALCETHQDERGAVRMPQPLKALMGGVESIGRYGDECRMKWIRQNQYTGKMAS